MNFKYVLLIALLLYSSISYSQEMDSELFRMISLAIIEQNENENIRQKLDSVIMIYDPVSGKTSFQISGEDSVGKRKLIESLSMEKAIQILDNKSLMVKPQGKVFYVIDSLDIFCKRQAETIMGYKFKKVKAANHSNFISLSSVCISSNSAIITCSFSNTSKKLTIHSEIFDGRMKIKRLAVD